MYVSTGLSVNLYTPLKIEKLRRINVDFWVMKTSRFNEGHIIKAIKAIKEHEVGRKAKDIVRDLGISQGTFYKWNTKLKTHGSLFQNSPLKKGL